jgi:low affinity Fe/Cu permease
MNFFDRAAAHIARLVGHPVSFALACLVILVWASLGPLDGYSDTWQLIINTSTTIVTFLMVFLIQNTQNRDNQALHLKIDELLRALDAADTRLVDLEERSEQELQKLHDHYRQLANGSDCDEEAPDRPERKLQGGSEGDPPPRNQRQRRGVQEPKG